MNNLFVDEITKEDIQALPLIAFEGNVTVIEDDTSFIKAIDLLEQESLLGFDTEKKPTFKRGEYNPTAMVQLSSHDHAFLFRINKVGYRKPLFDLMADPQKIKLGISIKDDIKELKRLHAFEPNGFCDLNDLAKDIGVKHIGVKKLAAIFLAKRISKAQQTSNWENEVLTKAQQKYAATDAWICLKIHEEMSIKGYI